jgi:hypothetical protein
VLVVPGGWPSLGTEGPLSPRIFNSFSRALSQASQVVVDAVQTTQWKSEKRVTWIGSIVVFTQSCVD